MKDFDLIVVGAGTAGCLAAKTSAKQGYKVCLIDHKAKLYIGDKVCGDGVSKYHFSAVNVSSPKGDELARNIAGADLYSPNAESVFRIKGTYEGFIINRWEFGQRLLNETLDAGAELRDQTHVLEPIMKDDFVIGVKAKNLVNNTSFELFSDVTLDASGFMAVLRDKMPEGLGIEKKIDGKDTALLYREIRELKTGLEDPEYLKIYLNQDIAPGGYSWIFPKDDNKVNVGVGVKMTTNYPNPKDQLYEYILSQKIFKDSKVVQAGGGLLSTRRPTNCMVSNGIMFLGDAAWLSNPVHGGGIGPSMRSGKIAAEVACKAIEERNVSRESLWPYHIEFMKQYGAKAAALDIFRLFLQKNKNEDLNYAMENKLIMEEDLFKASLGEDLRLNITEKTKRVFRGIRKPRYLLSLDRTSKEMKHIKTLYLQYPRPQKYDEWIQEVNEIIQGMESMVL